MIIDNNYYAIAIKKYYYILRIVFIVYSSLFSRRRGGSEFLVSIWKFSAHLPPNIDEFVSEICMAQTRNKRDRF